MLTAVASAPHGLAVGLSWATAEINISVPAGLQLVPSPQWRFARKDLAWAYRYPDVSIRIRIKGIYLPGVLVLTLFNMYHRLLLTLTYCELCSLLTVPLVVNQCCIIIGNSWSPFENCCKLVIEVGNSSHLCKAV